MPSDRESEPFPDITYGGFSDAPHPRPARRRIAMPQVSRSQLAIGAAAALVLGLLVGVWARPNLDGGSDNQAAERTGPAVPVEVGRPAPQIVRSNGKLQVLSPDVARAAASANTAAAMPNLGPPPPLPPLSASGADAVKPQPTPTPIPVTAPPQPAARSTATADCSLAGGPAEQLICADPELAAADRELAQAYGRALRSGVDASALRADQRDWTAIREEAARHSRRALAQVYRQRIDELNATADGRGVDEQGPGF